MSAFVAFLCLLALATGQQVQQEQQRGAAQQAEALQPAASLQVQSTAAQPAAVQATVVNAQPIPVQPVQPIQTAQPAARSAFTVGGFTGWSAPSVGVAGSQANYGNQGQQVQVLSAVDASRQLIAAAVAQGANANNFGIQTNAHYTIAQAPNPQVPAVWDALDALRGRAQLTIDEILNILSSAVAGRDYPLYNDIPSTRFTCENVKQAGFYADTEAQCQVIRRCDINGVLWSYLCPNMTLFNQITLVCDWFFNVNCQYSTQYYDYSNPRLYTQFALLDTPASNIVVNAVRPTAVYGAPAFAAPVYGAPANPVGYNGPANVPYNG